MQHSGQPAKQAAAAFQAALEFGHFVSISWGSQSWLQPAFSLMPLGLFSRIVQGKFVSRIIGFA